MQTTNENGMEVANTIRDQIGQRAFVMLGARNLLGDAKSLRFQVSGSPVANLIMVILDPCDTYTVQFFKSRGLNCPKIAEVSGVYADQLRDVIESKTGLRTSL